MARLYYNGPDARITSHTFESRHPIHRSFAIAELHHVHTPRHVRFSVRRPPLELRALYRGQVVSLYWTRDRLQFGQVTRALLRALDERRADLLQFAVRRA